MAIISRHTHDEDIIEKISSIKIECETNTGKKKTVCVSDIKGMLSSGTGVEIESYENYDLKTIKFCLRCVDYSMEIINE